MKFANATKLDRKPRGTQWRDLLFRLTCNKARFTPRGSAKPVEDR
jgi:hypothetical protein